MNRQQKESMISDVRQMMSGAQATFLVNYKGLSVPALQILRKRLRTEGSKLKITKATVMRIAAKDITGADAFAESFKEQVGLVFASKDVPGTAKQLFSFAKENESLKILAGFYESKVLSSQELNFLASLPSREVLISQLLGTLNAPMTNFVRVLSMLVARLPIVLKEIEKNQAEKK
jgi:large subunit ribosomal protein L10